MKLTDKYYREDSSEEEISLLQSRVEILEDNIILFRECPKQTPFSVRITFERIEELAESFSNFYLIVDLSEASRPDAPTRNEISMMMERLQPKLVHASFATGKNSFINAVLKFIMLKMGFGSYSVDPNLEASYTKICAIRDEQ